MFMFIMLIEFRKLLSTVSFLFNGKQLFNLLEFDLRQELCDLLSLLLSEGKLYLVCTRSTLDL
jgi:hypothetical protein